jgi:hypothetical protein
VTLTGVKDGPRKGNMQVKRTLALVALSALAIVATSTAAAPKKWYWTEQKAEARATTAIRIPHCWTSADDPRCGAGAYRPDGYPRVGWTGINEILCSGADERGETFAYARFRCRFVSGAGGYDYHRGVLTLVPKGARKFSWKLVSLTEI